MDPSAQLQTLLRDVPVYQSLDMDTITQLAAMLDENPLPTTPYFYHSMTFLLFLAIWVLTLLISKILATSFGTRYTHLNFDQRRTSDIYVLNIILTTITAVLQFAALSAFSLEFRPWHFNALRAAGMLISANYLFEIIYRPRMRWQMICHHLLTLFLSMLSISMIYKVSDPTVLLSANMLLFLATLEQPTFIALFLYRLRFPRRTVRTWLRVSSVQTIVTKSLAALGALAVWAKWQVHDRGGSSRAYDALLLIAIVLLYLTQSWGARVTWRIGASIDERYEASAARRQQEERLGRGPVTMMPSRAAATTTTTTTTSPVDADEKALAGLCTTPQAQHRPSAPNSDLGTDDVHPSYRPSLSGANSFIEKVGANHTGQGKPDEITPGEEEEEEGGPLSTCEIIADSTRAPGRRRLDFSSRLSTASSVGL